MSHKSFLGRTLSFTSLVIIALTVALALNLPPAFAEESSSISGAFVEQAELIIAISACGPGDTSCTTCLNSSGFFVEAQGLGDTSQGPMYLEIRKCFNPGGGSFGTYDGTFTMTASNGKDTAQGGASFTAVAGPITAGPAANTGVLTAFYSVRGNLELPN